MSLQPTFAEVFSKERSNEIILAFPYSETETTNPLPVLCMYNIVTGGSTLGVAYDINGNIFENIDQVSKACQVNNQYSNALWYQFDAEDNRRDVTLTSSWYDADVTRLKGTFVRKFLGKVSSATGYNNFDADQPVYRLPLAYLSLAEIANMKEVAEKELVVKPILDKQYAYRVLWPLSLSDINADPELEQTPGY